MCRSARLYHCHRCHTQVIICSSCDRGQRYCTRGCAASARLDSRRRAGKKYQSTRSERFHNASRQQRFRERQKQKVTHQGSNDPTLSALIGDRDSNKIQTHCWIIETSIEHDHEYFEGFLKVSLQKIIIALRNERHLLRDMNQAISDETQRRKGGDIDAGDFKQICEEVMFEISEQSPADNLYPNGFSADQFASVIESGMIWDVLH